MPSGRPVFNVWLKAWKGVWSAKHAQWGKVDNFLRSDLPPLHMSGAAHPPHAHRKKMQNIITCSAVYLNQLQEHSVPLYNVI